MITGCTAVYTAVLLLNDQGCYWSMTVIYSLNEDISPLPFMGLAKGACVQVFIIIMHVVSLYSCSIIITVSMAIWPLLVLSHWVLLLDTFVEMRLFWC